MIQGHSKMLLGASFWSPEFGGGWGAPLSREIQYEPELEEATVPVVCPHHPATPPVPCTGYLIQSSDTSPKGIDRGTTMVMPGAQEWAPAGSTTP